MNRLRAVLSGWRWVEPSFAVFILAGIAWSGWFFQENHYLPQPFFYNRSDTFGDWFNTAEWGRDNGVYDAWKSVYPPLSFLFLRVFSIKRCYATPYPDNPLPELRACDWLGLVAIWLIFLVNLALIWVTFRKLNPKTALSRTICVGLGYPMLDAVERGNLMLITFTCLLLALGPILRSARLRWLFAGLAVNFKVYLIAAFVPLLLKRRWRWVECALISVVLVYLVSYAIYGRGTPIEIFNNIVDFSTVAGYSIIDTWNASTYAPLASILKDGSFPIGFYMGSRTVDIVLFLIPTIHYLTIGLIVLAAATVYVRPEAVPRYRVISLGLLLATISSDSGLYSLSAFMLFVMMEPWRGGGRRWAIVACYILALPWDIPLDRLPEIEQELAFRGEKTLVTNYLTVGPFIRPLIIMTIGIALSLTTIREVWRDVRFQGWAGRWWLRRDAPLLPGVQRPSPPPTQ